jgi:hypothetical protein
MEHKGTGLIATVCTQNIAEALSRQRRDENNADDRESSF